MVCLESGWREWFEQVQFVVCGTVAVSLRLVLIDEKALAISELVRPLLAKLFFEPLPEHLELD